jgi:hypothetical protein
MHVQETVDYFLPSEICEKPVDLFDNEIRFEGEALLNGKRSALDEGFTPLFSGPWISSYALNSSVFALRIQRFGIGTA